MNLQEILRARIDSLPDGEYINGLKAVLQHIEVASNHLRRGQIDTDETAFTDAIYRTNQAFEGSLKEAYRVLTHSDPARETPNDIEKHLQQQNVLRPRVLSQLTNYRTEWRNPSTHDYRLDFDEDEALLAIVTVAAFAIVLIDQIAGRISFEQAKTAAEEHPSPSPASEPLLQRISSLIEQFCIEINQTHLNRRGVRESELVGALAGFFAATATELRVRTYFKDSSSNEETGGADMLITSDDESAILEVKRDGSRSRLKFGRVPRYKQELITQVTRYMEASRQKQAVLLYYNTPNNGEVGTESVRAGHGKLLILQTVYAGSGSDHRE